VFMDLFLVNTHRRRILEGARVVVSHRMAASGVAVRSGRAIARVSIARGPVRPVRQPNAACSAEYSLRETVVHAKTRDTTFKNRRRGFIPASTAPQGENKQAAESKPALSRVRLISQSGKHFREFCGLADKESHGSQETDHAGGNTFWIRGANDSATRQFRVDELARNREDQVGL
jgi:hypothetical protein